MIRIRIGRRLGKGAWAAVACGTLAAGAAQWKDPGVSGAWDEPANWTPAAVPAVGDEVTFSGAVTAPATVTLPTAAGPVKLRAFSLSGANELTFKGPGTLAITNSESTFAAGRVRLDDATFDYRPNGVRAIFGCWESVAARNFAYLTLGRGASLLFNDSNQILLAGDRVPGFRLTLEEGSRMAGGGIYLGRGMQTWGSVVQRGGLFAPYSLYGAFNENAFGAYELFAGTNDLTRFDTNWGCGAGTSFGFYQHGGLLQSSAGTYTTYLGSSGRCEVFVDGGLFDVLGRCLIPNRTSDTYDYDCPSVLSVGGAGTVRLACTPEFPYTSGRSRVQFNVNAGGTLSLVGGLQRTQSVPYAGVMFNGGLVERYTSQAAAAMNVNLFKNLDTVVYGGGVNIRGRSMDGLSPFALRLDEAAFRPARGYGVSAIAVTDGGADYLAPPLVTISGGAGSNATAIALIDHATLQVTNVTVTCPGEGYAAGDVLTVSFLAATGATAAPARAAAASVTLAPNGAGPFNVLDGTSLTLGRALTVAGDVTVAPDGALAVTGDFTAGGAVRLAPNTALTVGGTARVAGGVTGTTARVVLGDGSTVAGDVRIDAGVYRGDGLTVTGQLVRTSGALRLGGLDASETTLRTTAAATPGALTLGGGKIRLLPGVALTCASLAREAGALLYWQDAWTPLATFTAAPATSGTAAVLPGGLAANAYGEATGELVAWDAANSTFAACTPAAAGDAALYVTGATALSGATVVPSGMIVGADSASKSITGGTLTTGNGRDLVVYEHYVSPNRREGGARGLTLSSQIVDAAADAPTALVLAGYKNAVGHGTAVQFKPGPYIELGHADNAYSGGTFVNDCAVRVAADGSFGAVPNTVCTNICVAGFSQIKGPGYANKLELGATRGLHVAQHAVLQLGPSDGNTHAGAERVGFVVNGPITGHGIVTAGEWTGSGSRMLVALNGDLGAFEGVLACMGSIRIPHAASIGPRARIHFWGVTGLFTESSAYQGDALLETSGTLARTTGTGPGQVCWSPITEIEPDTVGRDANGSGNGGFSAVGGPLTVSLTAPIGGTLAWGSTPGVVSLNTLRLQNESSTDPLTWTGDLDITSSHQPGDKSLNRHIQIGRYNTAAEVLWTGSFLNTANGLVDITGRGRLSLAGSATVASTVRLYSTAAQLGAYTDERVSVDGILDFSANPYPDAGFTMRGAGTCALNAANILHGVAVEGGTLEVNGASTATNLTVAAAGALAGTGTLAVTGDASLAGALVARAGATAPLLTVDGDVTFASGATVVPADAETLDRNAPIAVMTWTGSATGRPQADARSPQGWRPRIDGQTLAYVYVPASMSLIVR